MRSPLAFDIESRDYTLNKDAKLVNAFVDSSESGKMVIKRPALTSITTYGASLPLGQSCYGMGTFKENSSGNKIFTVFNNELYSIDSDGVLSDVGAVTGIAGNISWTDTDEQPYLFFHDAGNAFVWSPNAYTNNGTAHAGGVVSRVSSAAFPTEGGAGSSVTATIGSAFTATVAGYTMTVSAVSSGIISIGDTIIFPGVAHVPTLVQSFGTGTGGTGTYTLSYPLTVSSSTAMNSSGNVLNVTAVSVGSLGIGQSLFSAGYSGTLLIQSFGTGSGGTGTYIVQDPTVSGNLSRYVPSSTFTVAATTPKQLASGTVYLDDTVYVMTTDGVIYNSEIENPTVWGVLDYVKKTSEPDYGVAIVKHLTYLLAFGKWSGEFFYDAANPTGSPLLRNDNLKIEIGCVDGNSVVQYDSLETVVWVGRGRETGIGVYNLEGTVPKKISTRAIETFLNYHVGFTLAAFPITIAGHPLYVLSLYSLNGSFVYDFKEKLWYFWEYNSQAFSEYVTTLSGSAFALVYNGSSYLFGTINETGYQDTVGGSTLPINYTIVTTKVDGGNNKYKFIFSAEVIGDRFSSAGNISISYSDDDYNTWSTPRTVDMSLDQPIIYQLGNFRRRAFKITCTENQPVRLEGIELNITQGLV